MTRSPARPLVVAAAALALIVAAAGAGCGRKKIVLKGVAPGLVVEEVREGTGAVASKGKLISVHYRGRFPEGTEFDNSYDRGQPIEFLLGTGKVIKGWDLGLEGMKVGGKRRLTIPPELAYGARGTAPDKLIPPNATLVFDVELVGVK
jgi:FKBP-type peptidyl-prolyl cis-trans isomerase